MVSESAEGTLADSMDDMSVGNSLDQIEIDMHMEIMVEEEMQAAM